MLESLWTLDLVSRNTNVSHTAVLKPLAAGYFNMSWASINYQSPENKMIVSACFVCLTHDSLPTLCILSVCVAGVQQCSRGSAGYVL